MRCMVVETFYSSEELTSLGLNQIGKNVKISRKTSIYHPEKVSLGDDVQIADFCILSGTVELGSFVHLGAYTAIYGQNGVHIGDFTAIAPRVLLFSTSNDYSGEHLTHPHAPPDLGKGIDGTVNIGRHCIVGAGSIVLPGVSIEDGVAIGAMSLVKRDLEGWKIYAGVPCRCLKNRSKKVLEMEHELFMKRK